MPKTVFCAIGHVVFYDKLNFLMCRRGIQGENRPPSLVEQVELLARLQRVSLRCETEERLNRFLLILGKLRETVPKNIRSIIDYMERISRTNLRVSSLLLEKCNEKKDVLAAVCGERVLQTDINFNGLLFGSSVYGLIVGVPEVNDIAKIEQVITNRYNPSSGFYVRIRVDESVLEGENYLDVIVYHCSDYDAVDILSHEIGHVVQRILVLGKIDRPIKDILTICSDKTLSELVGGLLVDLLQKWQEQIVSSELLADAFASVTTSLNLIEEHVDGILREEIYSIDENLAILLHVVQKAVCQQSLRSGNLSAECENFGNVPKEILENAIVILGRIIYAAIIKACKDAAAAVRAIRLLDEKGYTGIEIAMLFSRKHGARDVDIKDLDPNCMDWCHYNVPIQHWLEFARRMPNRGGTRM